MLFLVTFRAILANSDEAQSQETRISIMHTVEKILRDSEQHHPSFVACLLVKNVKKKLMRYCALGTLNVISWCYGGLRVEPMMGLSLQEFSGIQEILMGFYTLLFFLNSNNINIKFRGFFYCGFCGCTSLTLIVSFFRSWSVI